MIRWECHRTRDELIRIHMDVLEWIKEERNFVWAGVTTESDRERFIQKQIWLNEFGNLEGFSVCIDGR